jgi:hypothetical protein
MTTSQPSLNDALLREVLARRASGPSTSTELVSDVLAAVAAVPQRHGWAVWLTPQQRFLPGVLLTLLLLTLLVALVVGVIGGQPRRLASADLGVFEPVRGRVVYRVGTHLEAVDPFDASSHLVVEPGDLGLGARAMPVGWSADGSKLALTDEYNGALYVMDQTGSLRRVLQAGGCCAFVSSAWLSPDGRHALAIEAPERGDRAGRLSILDLDDPGRNRAVEMTHFEWATGEFFQASMPVWSPDASQAAYVWSKGGNMDTPVVGIIDLSSGASRELISGWGLIRQLAWSPDGSQLLIVAGEVAPVQSTQLNPLVRPQPTSLYLVDIDDAQSREVASGYYVAAAWSPDGTRVAAIDYSPDGREVVVIDADGSGGHLVLAELHGPSQTGIDAYLFTGVAWHPLPPSGFRP